MRIIYGQHTEKGIREENQDAVAVFKGESISFFAVADGAGGLSSGRQASQMVINAVKNEFSNTSQLTPESLITKISEKYRQLNAYINDYKLKHGIQMATTLTMLHIIENNYIISNIGDTQIIYFNKESCKLVTQVHNLAWLRYLNGEIAFKDIRKHRDGHILTRALGAHENAKPYVAYGKLYPHDLFLLCSDGVYNYMENQEIYCILEKLTPQTNQQMDGFCRELVSQALNNGSSDNCTVVAVKVL